MHKTTNHKEKKVDKFDCIKIETCFSKYIAKKMKG